MKIPVHKSFPFLIVIFIVLILDAIGMFVYSNLGNSGNSGVPMSTFNTLTPEEQDLLIEHSSSTSGKDMLVGKERTNVIKQSTATSSASSLTPDQAQALIQASSVK